MSPRQRRAVALRESEPQYRLLFEQNPVPSWVFDVRSLRFLAVNDAAVEAYGFSRREFLTMSILDIRPAEDLALVERLLAIARTGTDVHGSWKHRRKSGEVFEVEAYWSRVMFRRRPALLVLAIDVTRRRRADRLESENRALEAEVAHRTRMATELVRVQEQERRRIARELHDEIGQTLTGLTLGLKAIATEAPAAADKIAWAQSMVDGLMKQVRELSLNLRPSLLDDLGLLSALAWQIERYTAQTGVKVAFTHAGLQDRLAPALETVAFRIVQEALTNVARHARAAAVTVRVSCDPSSLTIIVSDEGAGFAPDAAAMGAGIAGMRERAALIGGELRVDSAPGEGTTVTALLPVVLSEGLAAT